MDFKYFVYIQSLQCNISRKITKFFKFHILVATLDRETEFIIYYVLGTISRLDFVSELTLKLPLPRWMGKVMRVYAPIRLFLQFLSASTINLV